MIFRFTKNSQTKLKTGRLPAVEESSNLLYEWYVNVFFCMRHKYFITTNAATLFTVIIYGAGIKDDTDYFGHIFNAVRQQMQDVSLDLIFQRMISSKISEIIYANTINRSILGSMNDMTAMAKLLIQEDQLPPFEISKFINDTPFKYIGMHDPLDCLVKYKKYD